ncbi:MAG TPA: M23 family metallopeptidase, partial [Arenibaculum sp.]|nr:M23 family metallopeptidase [Arenibaculum sp.]
SEAPVVAAVPAPAPAPPVPAARPSAGPPPVVEPPPRASARFAWPVHGEILSEFGSKADGMHNDGINIAAPQGTEVFAAENGVVAYAGNELRGFGNLLLIRHADGWMTAYAHLDRMAVRRGDRVGRGQSIGTIGSTGSVSVPQLHFEVRKGSRAVDPKGLLDDRQVSRDVSPGVRPGPG